jgi:hypothetical protein
MTPFACSEKRTQHATAFVGLFLWVAAQEQVAPAAPKATAGQANSVPESAGHYAERGIAGSLSAPGRGCAVSRSKQTNELNQLSELKKLR